VNILSGMTTAIRRLAETIKDMVGFEGQIVWDTSKPNGQMVKCFAGMRLRSLGLNRATPLPEGLGRSSDWLARNYPARTDGISL
jgi:GDP-L-fucose synthase